MKICLYGSGSVNTPKEFTDIGYELGLKFVLNNHSLVFGGGNNGMMGAVAKGVFDNCGEIISIAPEWIGEFESNFNNCTTSIKTESMDERKNLFLEKSDAFVIVPGGFGTLDEFFEIVVLKFLKRHDKEIILFNINGFFDTLILMIDEMSDQGFIKPGGENIFKIATNIDDVLALLD
jgi:hypothetical protein